MVETVRWCRNGPWEIAWEFRIWAGPTESSVWIVERWWTFKPKRYATMKQNPSQLTLSSCESFKMRGASRSASISNAPIT
jgi:hypothetical protein